MLYVHFQGEAGKEGGEGEKSGETGSEVAVRKFDDKERGNIATAAAAALSAAAVKAKVGW